MIEYELSRASVNGIPVGQGYGILIEWEPPTIEVSMQPQTHIKRGPALGVWLTKRQRDGYHKVSPISPREYVSALTDQGDVVKVYGGVATYRVTQEAR